MNRKFFIFFLMVFLCNFMFANIVSRKKAENLIKEEKFEEAINILDLVLKNNPEEYIAYLDRAEAKTELKLYNQALDDINKSIELCPYSLKAYYSRSVIYSYLEEYEKAIQDAEYVISISQSFPDAYNQRGYCYLKLKNFKMAEADFNKAIVFHVYSTIELNSIYINRAVSRLGLNNFESALADVDFALSLNSDKQFYYILKLFLLKILQKNNLFDEFLNKAYLKFPDNKDILIFCLARDIEKIDMSKINFDIEKLNELKCNSFIFHKLLKVFYLLNKDYENYEKEIDILNHPENLEEKGDFNIIIDINSNKFMEIYGINDEDIIYKNDDY